MRFNAPRVLLAAAVAAIAVAPIAASANTRVFLFPSPRTTVIPPVGANSSQSQADRIIRRSLEPIIRRYPVPTDNALVRIIPIVRTVSDGS